MLLAAEEVQRGWGGPVGIGIAVLVMIVFALIERKINNPSPTADDAGGDDEFSLLTDDFDDDPLPLSRGDVDLDRPAGWVDAGHPLDLWLLDNLNELGFRDTVHRAVLKFNVSPGEVTARIRKLQEIGY